MGKIAFTLFCMGCSCLSAIAGTVSSKTKSADSFKVVSCSFEDTGKENGYFEILCEKELGSGNIAIKSVKLPVEKKTLDEYGLKHADMCEAIQWNLKSTTARAIPCPKEGADPVIWWEHNSEYDGISMHNGVQGQICEDLSSHPLRKSELDLGAKLKCPKSKPGSPNDSGKMTKEALR